jgi:LysM repeat protein
MHKLRTFAVTAVLLAALFIGALPANASNYYVVRHGDTLFGIAARFNVSIYDVNAIYVGQHLVIPAPLSKPGYGYQPPPQYGPMPPKPGGFVQYGTSYTYYVVRPGDTLSGIAARFGVDPQAIMNANHIYNPNHIYVGQRLAIPKRGAIKFPHPRPPVGNIYIVQYGDNLFRIAARFHRDVYAIAKANGILNLNHIYAGMALVIP